MVSKAHQDELVANSRRLARSYNQLMGILSYVVSEAPDGEIYIPWEDIEALTGYLQLQKDVDGLRLKMVED